MIMYVCMRVSVCEHISENQHPFCRTFCSTALLGRRCDMLYTFGFMDDVRFAHDS